MCFCSAGVFQVLNWVKCRKLWHKSDFYKIKHNVIFTQPGPLNERVKLDLCEVFRFTCSTFLLQHWSIFRLWTLLQKWNLAWSFSFQLKAWADIKSTESKAAAGAALCSAAFSHLRNNSGLTLIRKHLRAFFHVGMKSGDLLIWKSDYCSFRFDSLSLFLSLLKTAVFKGFSETSSVTVSQ